MNQGVWLERVARADPHRPAVGWGDRVVATYSDLASRAAKLAGALRNGLKLQIGDRVGMISQNHPAYLETLYGTWFAGLAAVPINAKLHGAELGYILAHSGAKLCFVSQDVADELARHAPDQLMQVFVIGSPQYEALFTNDPIACTERSSAHLAWLFYTSGTTGKPKGAMLTHGNLAAMSFAYALEVDPVEAGDVLLHAAPMSHGSGLYMMAQVMRRAVNVVPESGGFDAGEIFRLFRHWRRVSMFAAPTMVRRLVASPEHCDPSAIRTIVYGGAPMYVEDAKDALARFGPRLAQIYGQGESPMTITTLSKANLAASDHPRWLSHLASAGLPFACVDVAVVDEEDRFLPAGEVGEIVCRGPTVMAGYWNDPAASAKTLAGGWLHTGDVGVFDEEGYLTLKDRSKDLIISGGSNIYPREVEEVLLMHPRVREVSVIGRPDPEWGESVVAYVVGEASRDELDSLCLERIARFKRPKHYVFVEQLPKNNYGKVLKTELRSWDLQATMQAAGAT